MRAIAFCCFPFLEEEKSRESHHLGHQQNYIEPEEAITISFQQQ
jgi:hypothetical protein